LSSFLLVQIDDIRWDACHDEVISLYSMHHPSPIHRAKLVDAVLKVKREPASG